MDSPGTRASPSLLPIFRSGQQARLLAWLLADPGREVSLAELSSRLGIPHPSVVREVNRAEIAGIVTSRRQGNVRLVRADTTSPYFEPLATILVRAFGPPFVLAELLAPVLGVDEAHIFGSWAARYLGESGSRPVGDIDLLVLGTPDREALYDAIAKARETLGRDVQVTIKQAGWLAKGSGSFHATVTGRPIVPLDLEQVRSSRPR